MKTWILVFASLIFVLVGTGLQLYVSATLSTGGWGRLWKKECTICGAFQMYTDGIFYDWQYIPILTPVESFRRPGRTDCPHEWQWTGSLFHTIPSIRCVFSKSSSPFSEIAPAIGWFALLILLSNICFLLGLVISLWCGVFYCLSRSQFSRVAPIDFLLSGCRRHKRH